MHHVNQIALHFTSDSEKEFYDILIDNQSIRTLFKTENITLFWGEKKWQYEALAQFRLNKKPSLNSGNVELLVCSECGDIGCGAITVKILAKDSQIIWKDFVYENGFDETDFTNNELRNFGPFVFDKNQYFNAFSKIRI